LFQAVYQRLKAMAGRQLAGHERVTLDTTALVHELYLRMDKQPDLAFAHPAQFFAYAARAMRHLLANRARDRLSLRAGGQWQRTTLTEGDERLALDTAEQALMLERAMTKLEQTDARAAPLFFRRRHATVLRQLHSHFYRSEWFGVVHRYRELRLGRRVRRLCVAVNQLDVRCRLGLPLGVRLSVGTKKAPPKRGFLLWISGELSLRKEAPTSRVDPPPLCGGG
jgi:hypothetical protein